MRQEFSDIRLQPALLPGAIHPLAADAGNAFWLAGAVAGKRRESNGRCCGTSGIGTMENREKRP